MNRLAQTPDQRIFSALRRTLDLLSDAELRSARTLFVTDRFQSRRTLLVKSSSDLYVSANRHQYVIDRLHPAITAKRSQGLFVAFI